MTHDRTKDPRLTSTHGVTPGFEKEPAAGPAGPDGQHSSYWVLTEKERAKGFVRPVRHKYVHDKCGVVTKMGSAIAETYAVDPATYGSTFCVGCKAHFPVSEFKWDGTEEVVGS